MSYFPGRLLLGKPGMSTGLGYATPLAGAAMALVAAALWHAGLKRYQGVGH